MSKRLFLLILLIPTLITLKADAKNRAQINWDRPSSSGVGLFSETTNWNPAQVPGIADDAYINNGGTVDMDATPQSLLSFNVGTSGGNGYVEQTSYNLLLEVINSLEIGLTGGTGLVYLDDLQSMSVGNDINIGVDGGTGSVTFGGFNASISLLGDLNIGVTTTGSASSNGDLFLDVYNGSLNGSGASRLAIGVSSSDGDAQGVFLVDSNSTPIGGFLVVDVGRAEGIGNAQGELYLDYGDNMQILNELNIGYGAGSGNATGILIIDDNDVGLVASASSSMAVGYNDGSGIVSGKLNLLESGSVSGFNSIIVGQSTTTSTGDTEAEIYLNGTSMSGTDLVLGDHSGAGTMDAELVFDIWGSNKGAGPYSDGYGAIDVETAALNSGTITANFRFVPLSGTYTFDLITAQDPLAPGDPGQISGMPNLVVNGLNQGFSVVSFGQVVDGNPEYLRLVVTGSPVEPAWTNPNTGGSAGSWFDVANWSSVVIPTSGDATEINNGGEAVITGVTAAEAFSLDIGTDGQNGIVTINSGELQLNRGLRVGTIDDAVGTSTGTITVTDSTITAGDADGYHSVGCIDANLGVTAVTGSMSLINSTATFDDYFILGEGYSPDYPITLDAALSLDNSTLTLANDFDNDDFYGSGGIKTVSFTMANNSVLNARGIKFGETDIFGSNTGTNNITITVTDSIINSTSYDEIVDEVSTRDADGIGRLNGVVTFTDAVYNSIDLEMMGDLRTDDDPTDMNQTIEATLNMTVTRTDMNLTNTADWEIGKWITAQMPGDQITANGTVLIDDSSVSISDTLEIGDADSVDPLSQVESTIAMNLVNNSSIIVGNNIDIGEGSYSEGGQAIENYTLSLSDSSISALGNITLSTPYHENSAVVQSEVSVVLDNSSLNIGGEATLGSLDPADYQPGQDYARADIDMIDSHFKILGNALIAVDEAEAEIDLNPSLLEIGGTATLGTKTTLTMHVEGTTRASESNLGSGDLYAAVDVADATLDGTLEVVFDLTPAGTHSYDLIISGAQNDFGATDFSTTNVQGLAGGATVDFFGKTTDDFGSGTVDVYRITVTGPDPTPTPTPGPQQIPSTGPVGIGLLLLALGGLMGFGSVRKRRK